MVEFIGDYHTHSRYSDGKEDVARIVSAAERRGLSEVAITDHGPRVIRSGVKGLASYDRAIKDIASVPDGPVRVLSGAEANIIDLEGTLDLPVTTYENLEVLICGLHPYTIPGSVKDGYALFGRNHLRHLGKASKRQAVNNNTKATAAALNHNPVDILSHPGLFFEVDVEEVARVCVREDVKFEINCGHRYPDLEKVMIADRVGVEFIVNSDAHFYKSVGDLEYGARLMEKLHVPPERVFNCKGGGNVTWKGKRKSSKFLS
jgi:putative hydrolase